MSTPEDKEETALKKPSIPLWQTILRWIAVLPASVVAQYVAIIFNRWTANYYDDDVVYRMSRSYDFGGHYIIGPVYAMQMGLICGAAFSFAGIKVAPSHKKAVLTVYGIGYVAWIVLGVFLICYAPHAGKEVSIEAIMRYSIQTIATAFGLLFGGLMAIDDSVSL